MIRFIAFRRYLNYQLVDLNYLRSTESNNQVNWFFVLSFFIYSSNIIRQVINLSHKEVNNLSYYFGDFTLAAGLARKQLTLIYLSWYIGAFLCSITLYRSQFNPSLQKWISIGAIFDNLDSTQVHPYTNLPTVVHKYFIQLCHLSFLGGGLAAALGSLPALFSYPQQFTIYLLFWLIVSTISGFIAVGTAANFGPLFAFSVYLFGSKISHGERLTYCSENDRLLEHMNYKINFSVKSTTTHLKQLVQEYQFWLHINQYICLASYNAQFVLLYLIFFTDIPESLRVALLVFGAINLISGLSVHFLLGAHGQHKIDQYCFRLKQILGKNISLRLKLHIMIFLEHVEKRYFFTIFGALHYSTHHFILVFIENIANLLLLIGSFGR